MYFSPFSHFNFFFLFVVEKDVKMLKNMFLTSVQCSNHPFTGQNTQQLLTSLFISQIQDTFKKNWEWEAMKLLNCGFKIYLLRTKNHKFKGAYNRTSRPALRRLPRGCRCRWGCWSRRGRETSSTPASSTPATLPLVDVDRCRRRSSTLAASYTPATSVDEVGQLVAAGRGRFQLARPPV